MNAITKGPWEQRVPQSNLDEFQPFSPADTWVSHSAPPIKWLVEGALIMGSVAILAGDGGLGKSLLMQQLMTAACCGIPWLNMRTEQCRSLAIFCEDDTDELHRRQERMNEHYGCRMSDLEGVMIEARPGRDCLLMEFPKWGGRGRELPRMGQLEYAARQHGAKLVVLDTRADVFGGNEIDRVQARYFIQSLRRLALRIQGCVVLTEHPSNEGLNSGSGRSGSTGWHNSVRSRMYLTKAKNEDDHNKRILRTMKQNYAGSGGKIELVWQRGVFVIPEDPYSFEWKD